MSHRPRPLARRTVAAAAGAAALVGVCVPLLPSSASAAGLAAPAPVAGAPGAMLKDVTLAWSAVAGATSYVVQVGQDETFSDKPTLELTTGATKINLPTYLPHADYAWRVAAVGKDGRGAWSVPSDSASFTRAWRDTVTLKAPAGPVRGLPEFSWSPVRSASEYQVQVSGSPAFVATGKETQASYPTVTCFTTRTQVTPFNGQANSKNDGAGDCNFPGMPVGVSLYWRVRPLDHVAEETQDVDTTPVADEGISSRPPAKQDSLDLTGCPDEDDESPFSTATPTPSASASPTAEPAQDATTSCDPANDVEKGAWSSTGTFSYNGPSLESAVGTYPDAPRLGDLPAGLCAATVCRDFPTLSWKPVAGASIYRVYVALDAAFSNIHEVSETPGLSYTPTEQWRDSALRSNYYYAVQACTPDACGNVQTTPGTFRKSSPAVIGLSEVSASTETVLSWQDFAQTLGAAIGGPATSEAFAYHVQVAKASDPSFSEPVDDATVDMTSHIATDKSYSDGDFIWRVQAVDASSHRLPWSAVRSFTRDYTGPKAAIAPTVAVTTLASGARFSVSYNEPVKGQSASAVRLLQGTSVVPTVATYSAQGAVLVPTRALVPGAPYAVSVTSAVTDASGNAMTSTSKAFKVNPMADDADRTITYSGAWKAMRSSAAKAGIYRSTNVAGGAATLKVYGTGVVLAGCNGPSSGHFDVIVDGVRKVRGNAYRSFSGCSGLANITGLPKGLHTVVFKATGTKSAASKGAYVGLDAVRALP